MSTLTSFHLGPGTGSGAANWNSWNMPQNSQSAGPSGKYLHFLLCSMNDKLLYN